MKGTQRVGGLWGGVRAGAAESLGIKGKGDTRGRRGEERDRRGRRENDGDAEGQRGRKESRSQTWSRRDLGCTGMERDTSRWGRARAVAAESTGTQGDRGGLKGLQGDREETQKASGSKGDVEGRIGMKLEEDGVGGDTGGRTGT